MKLFDVVSALNPAQITSSTHVSERSTLGLFGSGGTKT